MCPSYPTPSKKAEGVRLGILVFGQGQGFFATEVLIQLDPSGDGKAAYLGWRYHPFADARKANDWLTRGATLTTRQAPLSIRHSAYLLPNPLPAFPTPRDPTSCASPKPSRRRSGRKDPFAFHGQSSLLWQVPQAATFFPPESRKTIPWLTPPPSPDHSPFESGDTQHTSSSRRPTDSILPPLSASPFRPNIHFECPVGTLEGCSEHIPPGSQCERNLPAQDSNE